ncbi:uncharacterized protein BJX67DRAFT_33571 [Aspergillus lucknowensis]|uniref:Myb-like domain-containing protein n=1 Tax=Aspergillus lucknowensis TaxID=176173 RepID=A0ABR4L6L4_9EURO
MLLSRRSWISLYKRSFSRSPSIMATDPKLTLLLTCLRLWRRPKMSTFLFYNPNSNPSRYSQKARFSKRQSVLLGTERSAVKTEHSPPINCAPTSSVYPAQASIRNDYDLQLAEPAHSLATAKNTRPPNEDNGTFSKHDTSDVESLHSLFWESNPGASTRSSEVGELISSISHKNTQSPSVGGGLAPVKTYACITQTASGLGGQAPVRDSDQPSEVSALGPDLAASCLNLSPSPVLRAHDFAISDNHATGHESELIPLLRTDDPTNLAESAVLWDRGEECTSLNDGQTRMDADEGTSNGKCIVRSASQFAQHSGISSLGLVESSGFGSPQYSNDHDSPVENANGFIRDLDTCPITLAEETSVCDLNNTTTTPSQLLVGKEREGSVPNIAEVISESNRESPTILAGPCSDTGMQGHASAEPTTRREPTLDPSIVLKDGSVASDKSAPARSSARSSTYRNRRKTFAEFSHVEIPSRPVAEVSRPSVATTPHDRRDWSCHPSLTSGPWRLDGTTLSIDLRDAERVPIFIGYSSLRVCNGQLTQSLTFFQGPADSPPVNKSAGKPSPTVSARGPLSLEQKQRLVKLKHEGYTWDQIVTKFPGRKKRNLQAMYSRSLKDFRCSGSLHDHRSRTPFSAPRSSSNDRTLAEIAGNARIKARRMNQVMKVSYNLRPRGSR